VRLNGHMLLLIAYGPGLSRSGSMRQMPAVPSATHKCRTGWFVTGLIAVPCRTTPPFGPVIGLRGSGVPANWIVLVVGLTVVWALAMLAANPNRTTMQDNMCAAFLRTPSMPSGAEVVNVEFKWRLPLPWAGAQRSLNVE
jgi:hypothetical protein